MSASRLCAIGVIAVALAAMACGGSSGGASGKDTSNSLVLVDVSVGGFDGVPLNEVIVFEFSEDLDPDTVRPDTIQIREGPNYGWQVPGYFNVDGNMVYFYPRLPALPDLSDSGLQAGKPYRITLPGNPKVATLRSFTNEHLLKKTVVTFQTALTGSANIFVDNFLDPLPPRVLFVNPPDLADDVPAAIEIVLTLNRRPLHPASVTPGNVKLTMIERSGKPVNRPIMGGPELNQSYDSVTITYRPDFPLADDAKFELSVDRRVQDLVGNDLVPLKTTFSIRNEPYRLTNLALTFNQTEYDKYADLTATTASWNEVVDDALAALFTAAGGNGLAGDLKPTSDRNFTPDDFNRGVDVEDAEDGQSYHVYNFREINIPAGVTVRFSAPSGGPNLPVKLIGLKPIVVNGTLTVSGGAGKNGEANSNNSANPKIKGGACGPGGSVGSDSYGGSKTGANFPVQDGDDVLYGGGGGKGSHPGSANTYYHFGGGAGGGGARTPGKAGTKSAYPSSGYVGEAGKGGKSATQRGYPLNYERLPNVGGAGGGAGADGLYASSGRQAGAGGGGGGGALGLQSAGSVTIGSTGKILADGGTAGNGGSMSYWYGGPGGGGAGGSIKIRATKAVNFSAGATLSVKGGMGGSWTSTYTYYAGPDGGAAGDGWLRVEGMEDENSPGKPVINGLSGTALTYAPPSTGVYAPKGGGAPSIGQTVWMNLGVFDPVMVRPGAEDVIATLFNDYMQVEVQMATEDPNALGTPNLNALDLTDLDGDGEYGDTLDPDTLSEWTVMNAIEILNWKGYQFIRIRITFQLDVNQTVDLPLPYLDLIRFPYKF